MEDQLKEAMNKFSVVLATPYYEVKGYSPYIISLIDSIRVLNELKIPWDYYELSGDSYVDRAKNSIVNRFLKSNHTHLFMIDSDLHWNVEGFIRIIKAGILGAEIVGGTYPNKNNWDSFGVIPLLKDGQLISQEVNGITLYEMSGIPGGFILYSRKAFERTTSNLNSYIDPQYEEEFSEFFKMHIQKTIKSDEDSFENHIKFVFDNALKDFGNYKGEKQNERFLECFRCNVEQNKGRLGEDIYFQQRYREMGGTVWLEPNVSFKHFGVKGWEGNYYDFVNKTNRIETLRDKHKGETAWIIGKGPSLAKLNEEYIGDGPVIALYESLIPIEKLEMSNQLYSMQKDIGSVIPNKGETLLVHEHESSRDYLPDYKPRIIFDNIKDFGLDIIAFSAISAVEIAKLMGCNKVVFVCFDSCVNGDCRTYIPQGDGSVKVDNAAEEFYKLQVGRLKEHLNKSQVEVDWVNPT